MTNRAREAVCAAGKARSAGPSAVAFALALAAALSCMPGVASTSAAAADRPTLPPKLDDSVERGLAFLAKQQQADGSFADEPSYRTAETGLALLAFLSAGHTPEVGRYGMVVRAAAEHLTGAVPKDGYVGSTPGGGGKGPMYAQGIATVALAQVVGVEPNADRRRRQREALERLIGVILKAQAAKTSGPYAGGWRYTPDAPDSDLSLSGWNALALRAAQDVGVAVPKEAIERAAEFVLRCYLKEERAFGYQPGGPVRLGSVGTGVLCLYLLDRTDHPEALAAAKYLRDRAGDPPGEYEYYALYYATHAAFQVGDDVWADVSKVTLERLIKSQKPDGGWPKEPERSEPGRVYRTAMGVLTLTVPYRLLPIYQR